MGKHQGGSIVSKSHHSSHSHNSHFGHYHGHHHGFHHGHHGHHYSYNHGGTTVRCNPFTCFVFVILSIIIAVIVVGLLIAPWNKTYQLELGLLETYIFKPSTTWNKEIDLSTESVGFVKSYKFAKVPPIDPEKKTKTEQQDFVVAYNNFDSQSYYLIKDSRISLNYSSDRNLDFYVVKGNSQFSKWRNGEDVSYVYKSFSQSVNFTYIMPDTDDIYLIWRNALTINEIHVNAQIIIEMVSYDLSNPLETCEFNNTKCIFPLTKGSDEVVVVAAALSDDQNSQFQVSYSIYGRMNYYFAIFGGVVGACVVFGFFIFLVGLFIRRRRQYTQM